MMLGFIQNIGPWQLVLCLVIAYIFFGGAKKIPELARSLGKAKGEFQKGLKEGEKDLKEGEEAVEAPAKESAKELV